MQKRLYRPGFYVERHSDKVLAETEARAETETGARAETETETEAGRETPATMTPANCRIAANQLPVKMPGIAVPFVATRRSVKNAAVKKAPVLKRIAAAPKQLHKQLAEKTRPNAKLTEDQGYTLAIIGGIVLLVILAAIGYSIGDPLFVFKALIIGWYTLQVLAALAVLGLIIYGIWWLFDFMDGGCGF